jgi:hypothetical protein
MENSLRKYVMFGALMCVLGVAQSSAADVSYDGAHSGKAIQQSLHRGGEAGSGGGEGGSGGGEAGSGGGSADLSRHRGGFYSSCASAVGVLRRAIRMAEYQDGNSSAIRKILVTGLANALKEIPDDENPLTKLAIQRGLKLNSQFANGCRDVTGNVQKAQCLDLELRTAVFFLGKFYDYILTSVYPLDDNYYIPYYTHYYPHCRHHECLPPDFYDSFYVAYKGSARALLDFYIGNSQNGMPDALAMDTYELHVAENVLRWSSEDLNLDLFRREFACVIDDLKDASQDLADFNAGSTMIFRNSRQAVSFARETADTNASTLGGVVCGYRY